MTAVLERQMDDTTEPLGWPPSPRREPWSAPLLAVGGLLCTVLVAVGLSMGGAPPILPDDGPPEVVVTNGSYEPGGSTGWHVHAGLHSVVVLRGTLTVYDERCGHSRFGPGEVYAGGDRPHLVRNDGGETATYVVTYARTAEARLDPPTSVPSPCDMQ